MAVVTSLGEASQALRDRDPGPTLMVAAQQEATVSCSMESMLRDELEHVVLCDAMEASPEAPDLVDVQAAVDIGAETRWPLVRIPRESRDGLADLEAEVSVAGRRPVPRAWHASKSTGHRLVESQHGVPEDRGDRRVQETQDQRCDQLCVHRRVQKFQDQRCDQRRVEGRRKMPQPPSLMQPQNHESAASPGHSQGRGRTRGDHQQASETSPQTGAPCLQTQQ